MQNKKQQDKPREAQRFLQREAFLFRLKKTKSDGPVLKRVSFSDNAMPVLSLVVFFFQLAGTFYFSNAGNDSCSDLLRLNILSYL
mgnify:CR=1 FL=1